MTHDSAVRIVVQLAPKMEKESAADVLTKYARENDLPPSQLEKLAQVCNTMRTISHIDNASEEERGATVPLLDVPELVVGYATGWDQEKVAAEPLSFSSHDIMTIDLNSLLRRELSDGHEKAAAQATAAPGQVREKMKIAVTADAVESALIDMQVDLESQMAKLAGELIGAAPVDRDNVFLRDMADFEESAIRRVGVEAVKRAAAYLDLYAEPLRIRLQHFDCGQELAKYAYELQHAEGEKLAELATTANVYDEINKLAAMTMEEILAVTGESPDENTFTIPGGPVTTRDPALDSGGKSDTDKQLEEGDSKGLTGDNRGTGSKGQDNRKQRESDDSEKERSQGGNRAAIGDTDRKPAGKTPGIGSKAIGAVKGAYGALGNTVRGAASGLDATLSGITSKERQNKPQKRVDIDVADIRRAMNLSRMIANDPVLKEADPKELLEIYNSIVRRNPEMAGDMPSLKLILREAVNYEGLTLDSQKMLSEIRRNDAQGVKEEEENTKKRYSVGGASPISLI